MAMETVFAIDLSLYVACFGLSGGAGKISLEFRHYNKDSYAEYSL